MKYFSALFIAVMLMTGTASALAADKTPSKDEVASAISTFQKDPVSAEGFSAGTTILAFAKKSSAVHLSMSKAVVPWLKQDDAADSDTRGILLTAYLAGNIDAQLKNGKPGDEVYAGWQEVLATYAHLLSINPAAKVSEVDDLKRKEAAGTLKAYALEVQEK
jgi:hypothetical protein